MKTETTDPEPRKPYEKPKLRAVELAAGEVLVTGCKTAAGFSIAGISALTPCISNTCTGEGS